MTCRDCVHYEVCAENDAMLGEKTIDKIKGVETHCEMFKPKSRFVEVVRCKDCDLYEEDSEIEDFDGWCIGWQCETDRTGFCIHGINALKEREKE